MKNLRKSLFVVMAFAAIAFTFTSCSKSGGDHAEDVAGEVEDATAEVVEGAEGVADAAVEGAEGVADAAADVAEAVTTGGAAWSSDLDDWVKNGTGSKTITLDGIAGEGELSAEGRAQLDLIATILEANEGLNAVIKGHTTADQKMGNGKARAVWTKTKLIFGHDAVGGKISTQGVGSKEPIEGVDANDASQKRITVDFSK